MNLNARFLLWVKKIRKKYGKIILIVAFFWLIVFMINSYLDDKVEEQAYKKTYNPDVAIMDDGGNVPVKYRETIKSTIDTFVNKCKTDDYQGAWDMLIDDCKAFTYENNINNFKEYVDYYYLPENVYYIQNYSNFNDKYIYTISLMPDIESTGATDGIKKYEEKLCLVKNSDNDEFKLSNFNYIGKEEINSISENGEMKVKVTSKDLKYNKTYFNVTITNKTDSYMMLSDGSLSNEITIKIGNEYRKAVGLEGSLNMIGPNSTKDFVFEFKAYYDDPTEITAINLNSIRLISQQTYQTGRVDSSSNLASDVFSVNISLGE